MKNISPQTKFLSQAINDGHSKFTGEGKAQRIVYLAINHSERYSDPEEQARPKSKNIELSKMSRMAVL
jgi:type I restriction enzyme M protein